MSNTLNNVRICLYNKTASQWTTDATVLLKGEMGIESNTNKFKIGDGTTDWANLAYAGTLVSASETNGNIKIDGVETTVYTLPVANTAIGGVKSGGDITVANDGGVTVNKAAQLTTARDITLTGDVTGTASFDGSANTSISSTLANSGVTAGTYTKVTVDAKGRVTVGADLAASDITGLLGTAATKDVGTSSGNVPVLDASGKLSTTVLPALAITDTYTAASQADMLALSAQKGDICIRTDESKTYILTADDATTLANWKELATPADAVTSVNTKTGAVTLDTDDISEGSTNLYYTSARFDADFATKASTGLTDTADLVRYTDTGIIINCGQASS